ncbi:MAG TPA: succinylglutamate desuccinylase/aspartoacylase family protein [Chloroflexota bacterium]
MTAPSEQLATEFDPETLAPGFHRLWLTLEPPPLGQPALPALPVLCWRGSTSRPRLIATAGVHGDEYEGPEALWRLDRLGPRQMHGCLIALPCCNPWAANAATRATPESIDGLNLARLFPGDVAGRPTERLADSLFRLIHRLAGPDDLLVDLHAGGVALEFLPVVGYRALPGLAIQRSEAAARSFGIERLWCMAPHAGTLTDAAMHVGIACVGAEMAGTGGARSEHVTLYRDGVYNLLRFQGILPDRPPPRTTALVMATTNVLASDDGRLLLHVAVGDQVQAGQALGQIVTILGEHVAPVRAPCSGMLWALRHLRQVARGDLVATVAAP